MADIKGETLALSALFQCCAQISRVANTGFWDEHAAACVIRGLLVTDPKTCEDIYAPGKLMTGFKQLADSLDKSMGAKGRLLPLHKMHLKLLRWKLVLSAMKRSSIAWALKLTVSRPIFWRLTKIIWTKVLK